MTNQFLFFPKVILLFFLWGSSFGALANDLTFEDAQVRTAHAREQMESKKKELDAALKTEALRSGELSKIEEKRAVAEEKLTQASKLRENLEKEYETLQKKWAEEAKMLKKIFEEERR